MGSWNGTCAVSNLHIRYGQDVVVLMLAKNNNTDSYCYNNSHYDLCYVPFYGKYNDYGAVEDCHGFGMNIVVDSLRRKLYRFGQGPNSFHDIEVNKDNFDIDKLFEADLENRLGIHDVRYNGTKYEIHSLERMRDVDGLTEPQRYELARLANVLAQKDDFRQVTHVQIHGDIFRDIMKKWYIEEYVGNGEGNKGYENNYTHLYFDDVVASIPEYISRIKEQISKNLTSRVGSIVTNRLPPRMRVAGVFDWDDKCVAGSWLTHAYKDGDYHTIVDISDIINEYVETEDWDGLAAFAKEVLTVMWIDKFMSYSRKPWIKQVGAGSQTQEPLSYQVLANSVLDILKAENEENEDE